MLNGVNVTKTRENSKENHDALCAKISDVLDYLTDSERGRMLCLELMRFLGPRIADPDPFEKKLVSPDACFSKYEMAKFEAVDNDFFLVKTLMKVIKTHGFMHNQDPSFKPKIRLAPAFLRQESHVGRVESSY